VPGLAPPDRTAHVGRTHGIGCGDWPFHGSTGALHGFRLRTQQEEDQR
jgi:hypothetical protein